MRSSEWLDDLKEVFFTITKAEQYLIGARNNVAIDSAFIFNQIDQFNLGYITSRSLADWLSESVGFKLNEFETRLVMNRYDKRNSYSINLAEFAEEVAPVEQEEDEEEEGEEGGRRARLEEGYPEEEGHNNEEEAGDNYEDDEFSEEENQDMRRRYMSGAEEEIRQQQKEEEDEAQPEEEAQDDDEGNHQYLEGLGDEGDESPNSAVQRASEL